MRSSIGFCGRVILAAVAGALTCADVDAGVEVLGVQYKADQVFPEHECFWHESEAPGPCSASSPMGGSIHVFLRNTGASAVTVQDVEFAGFSLGQVLALHYQVEKRQPASIWLAGLSSGELQTLVNAGEPVWYKTDPGVIAAGGVAQVVVRLRQTPQVSNLNVDVVHSEGTTSASVPVQPTQPALAGASFSPDMTTVQLYWRRAPAGTAPSTILFNGTNVTASTVTVADPTVTLAASVLRLAGPVPAGSLHIFQGVYADGAVAGAAVRAWTNDFIYATWGARAGASGDYAAARAWIDEATNHFVNALEVQGGSDAVKDYLKTAEGKQYAAERGYGCVIDTPGLWGCTTPRMWFIRDEPDNADTRVEDLPWDKMVGSLAQMAVQTGESLRANYLPAPTTINLDGAFKPLNYYNYGQVPDVMMSDPYYQVRLQNAMGNPQLEQLYRKATYIYAVSQVAQAAAEPNPLHIILYSCQQDNFPFAPPATKRIEVYYALAAGAKGMAYWWFLPPNGLGAGTAAANALWREIGVLGAEIRTAAPLLVRSCPATVALQPGSGVWARSLVAGTNTLMLLVVNDQYANDQAGCHYTNVPNATVTVTLPSWLAAPTAFEITAGGLGDVSTQAGGNQLQVNLGTLALTRMIVLTTNPQLRAALQQRYNDYVRAGVCALAPEWCAPSAPSIGQQPLSQTVAPGGWASFSFAVAGSSPLSYRWQKNQVSLSDGGHYSGCTAPTLVVTNADSADTASYRCIVTNAYGSVTSSVATLTVGIATNPPSITQQPVNRSVGAGGATSFTVGASGSGTLGYQWQKNLANLPDGGHYSGCATATLTISNADSADAASYRCVVTNGYGSATSSVATLTVTNINVPPGITQQPVNRTVALGGSTSFTVGASGSGPLSYQWQKNLADLVNGGHYAGCTTATLTISSVDNNDLASYRCVVTNAYGSAVSGAATLTLPPTCPGVALLNGSFEQGNPGELADDWIAYQRAPYPTNTLWRIQTASPPAGLQYQEIANSSSTGGAGVRQDVTGCTIGATYTVSGWMRGNSSANTTCRVLVSPTASTNWSTAVQLASYAGPAWTPFSATIKATGTSMTIWLDGQTGGSGQFKAQCFDAITVACTTMPAPLRFESVTGLAENQVRLVLSGEPGTTVTLSNSTDLVSWLLSARLTNTTGTVEYIEPTAGDGRPRFYRASQP